MTKTTDFLYDCIVIACGIALYDTLHWLLTLVKA